MSLFTDKKFVSLVASKLDRFQQKSEYLWNFRCPYCGDSSKNKIKARGYIYRRKSDLFFTCHNCGLSISFANFLKAADSILYREYQMERFKNESAGNVPKPSFDQFKTPNLSDRFSEAKINLPTISSLPDNHEAKSYLLSRKLPRQILNDLYYAQDFKSFCEETLKNFDKNVPENEKRIVIPFYNKNNVLLGFQGRAVGESKIRYITILLDSENDKIFGLNKVDLTKKVYVVEGPIDSLFLDNSLAVMDAALFKIIKEVGDYNYVFVYDNEPRNPDIVKNIKKTIEMGRSVCIWPQDISVKDINDMVINGLTPSEIMATIDRCTFTDLRAMLEFNQWKKI